MAKRTVVDPQGERWRVQTKWLPRKLRWRGTRGKSIEVLDGAELLSVAGDLPVVGVIAAVIAALVLAAGLLLFIVPALVFVLELLLVLVLVGFGVAGRVLFGRPWTVEARRVGSDDALEWKVRGWGASSAMVDEVADQLEAGLRPPNAVAVRRAQ